MDKPKYQFGQKKKPETKLVSGPNFKRAHKGSVPDWRRRRCHCAAILRVLRRLPTMTAPLPPPESKTLQRGRQSSLPQSKTTPLLAVERRSSVVHQGCEMSFAPDFIASIHVASREATFWTANAGEFFLGTQFRPPILGTYCRHPT